MFGKLFDDVIGVASDAAKIAVAPIAIAATVTRAATKPIADVAKDVVDDVREGLNELK